MDGLASLAVAANLVGFADVRHASPMKRKMTQQAPRTPTRMKKKRESENQDVAQVESEETPSKSVNDYAHSYPTMEVAQSSRGCPLADKIIRTLNPLARLWCAREWFYSTLDRDYFHENEFTSCLHQIGLPEVTKLTRADWSRVRSLMGSRIGRPRRFSPAFLREARDTLHRYRSVVRRLHVASSTNAGAAIPPASEFSYQVYEPVGVGDMVTALHLPSCSLQRGQVLAVNTWSERCIDYLVQFDQVELGHGVVADDMLAAHGSSAVLHRRRRAPGAEAAPRLARESSASAVSGCGDSAVGSSAARAHSADLSQTERFFLSLKQTEGVGVGPLRAESSRGEGFGGPLQQPFEVLWRACLLEAEQHVSTRRAAAEESESSAAGASLGGLEMAVVPALACLFFIRRWNTDVAKSVQHLLPVSSPGEGGGSTDTDAAVSAFLCQKITDFYEPDSELARKLSLLFGLANSLSGGHVTSRTLLEQAQHRHSA